MTGRGFIEQTWTERTVFSVNIFIELDEVNGCLTTGWAMVKKLDVLVRQSGIFDDALFRVTSPKAKSSHSIRRRFTPSRVYFIFYF